MMDSTSRESQRDFIALLKRLLCFKNQDCTFGRGGYSREILSRLSQADHISLLETLSLCP